MSVCMLLSSNEALPSTQYIQEEAYELIEIGDNVTAIIEETKAPTVRETKSAYKLYSIHGVTPPIEWQKALYKELDAKGIAWYMPYAVCQIWQESRWDRYTDNGQDKGICQQKGIYWANRASYYGVPGADIWDVYAQFHVYAGMMSSFLKSAKGNVEWALSFYFYGSGEYAPEYISHVTSHLQYLKEIGG